jgi:hypothetical protein
MGMTRETLAACALALIGTAVGAQQPPPVDVTTIGPQVGERAIEFRLPDQTGREQTLGSVAGSKGTMLVFFRSSDW